MQRWNAPVKKNEMQFIQIKHLILSQCGSTNERVAGSNRQKLLLNSISGGFWQKWTKRSIWDAIMACLVCLVYAALLVSPLAAAADDAVTLEAADLHEAHEPEDSSMREMESLLHWAIEHSDPGWCSDDEARKGKRRTPTPCPPCQRSWRGVQRMCARGHCLTISMRS